jgi:hypothetical protein
MLFPEEPIWLRGAKQAQPGCPGAQTAPAAGEEAGDAEGDAEEGVAEGFEGGSEGEAPPAQEASGEAQTPARAQATRSRRSAEGGVI